MVLNEALKMRSVRLVTSPTMSWRRAWSLTRFSPLMATFWGSFSLIGMPKSVTFSGRMAFRRALKRRLGFRAVGAPFFFEPLTDLWADPLAAQANSGAAFAGPHVTPPAVVAVSAQLVSLL